MMIPLLIFAQVSGVQIHPTVTPSTAYVGQQISFDVGIRMNVLAQTSFQSNPEYTPPDVQAAATYDFPFDTNTIKDVKTPSGLSFREFLYHRAIFPLTVGKYTIPAAALKYTLPNEADPFDPPKEYSLKGEPVSYTVIPVPDAGKPVDFGGAVGKFTAVASTATTTAKVGEPFILTMVVTGEGNIRGLLPPPIVIPWATVTTRTEQPTTWDSVGAGSAVHGTKTFSWIVSPKSAGQLSIPSLRYAYFDPAAKQYAAATTTAIPMTVAGGSGAAQIEKHDASTSPFPAFMRWVGSNILLILGAIVVLAGAVWGLIALARNQEPVD